MRKEQKAVSVAIDGTVGSGKSTVAKQAAQTLGYCYIDTGAMYRAVALYCLRKNIDLSRQMAVVECLEQITLDFANENGAQQIYLNGEDVTDKVRTQEVAMGASKVAAIEEVRDKLVEVQRNLAKNRPVVMDGRDIGTVVLPGATVKIYMTATIESRTERRCHELQEKGLPCDYEKVKNEIIQRDYNDMNREHAPLRQAIDAVYLDTSDYNLEESVRRVIQIITEKTN